MTVGVALVLLGALMLYCAIEGKSLRHALVGHAQSGGSGMVVNPS